MEKIREKKAVKRAEKKKQAAKKNVEALPTLFVRNIGWDTTEKDFKEYMESFGPVKYAVLCRVNEFNDSENIKTGQQGKSETHKGSGFVKFADAEHAQHLLELSQKIEEKLDEERKKMKADSKKKNNNKKDT